MTQRSVTGGEIAAFLNLPRCAPSLAALALKRVSGIPQAGPDAVVFAVGDDAIDRAVASDAGLILAGRDLTEDARMLLVADPRAAFARVYQKFFAQDLFERGLVSDKPNVRIHASAVLGEGVSLGAGTAIAAGAILESGVVIGGDCTIGPRVVIHQGTTLANRVRVQAGTVLGSAGFGYARTATGYIGFPQIGTLRIDDDVDIGANVTIDRGALGETRIGRGTKIDNLVHIAHNCVIGEDVLIAAQVGMAGSCTIEDGAMLGGQVGLGEHVVIGKGVVLGGQGGVLPGKRIDGDGVVFWGTPAQPVREYLRGLARQRRGR